MVSAFIRWRWGGKQPTPRWRYDGSVAGSEVDCPPPPATRRPDQCNLAADRRPSPIGHIPHPIDGIGALGRGCFVKIGRIRRIDSKSHILDIVCGDDGSIPYMAYAF